ncbi:CONSTANS-like 4 [Tripterygium wilfordii]|uniref:CONSTANS-like 4 n=1 Tax=Tripterygium wilfordii TaxID=458696 RepID=A0A7J7BWN9_TRIWF|nr:zinc finger protein CONSTANS-LIKE 4-like [Tripterygium wilfordii]KAF5726292.1 CONSTANS-like 4 [Tripterygium wilfordii]
MASKLCDSCKSASATLFCRSDSAFLCLNCDSRIQAANQFASRRARVWLCEVCEQAPAHVTCKADAAALCVTCDRDIHSANPLARRHERVPVTPFYDAVNSDVKPSATAAITINNFLDNRYFTDIDADADVSREEAEAASWLLPNPPKASENPNLNTGQYAAFSYMDPYLDLDYGPPEDPKSEAQEQNSSGTDGVVPIQNKNYNAAPMVNDKYNCFAYGYSNHPCLSQSISSSSLDVGVVPDGNAMADISTPYGMAVESAGNQTMQISSVDREARVMRYREKRKNRKFEKTIRYASRKAYAETRPRIKGRFVKRADLEPEVEVVDRSMYGYGVVPSF